MSTAWLKRSLILATVALIAVAACLFWPREPRQNTPEELVDHRVRLPGGVQPYVEPDWAQKRLVARIQEKQAIVQQLLRGETNLAMAAFRFKELHGDDVSPLLTLRSRYPKASEEELWQRHVIVHVNAYAPHDPKVPALVRALEAEVAERSKNRQQIQPKTQEHNSFGPTIVDARKRLPPIPGRGRIR